MIRIGHFKIPKGVFCFIEKQTVEYKRLIEMAVISKLNKRQDIPFGIVSRYWESQLFEVLQ